MDDSFDDSFDQRWRPGKASSATNIFQKVGKALEGDMSFKGKAQAGGTAVQVAMGLEAQEAKAKEKHERRISRANRNRLLGIAFGCLLFDALLSFAFCLMAPADPRLRNVYASRRQMRTVTIQGFVSLLDAIVSAGVVVHVVAGILSASLDSFLEAARAIEERTAATKLLQAIFFSLLQTGYPTFLRLSLITLLLLLRVSAAALIFRAAFLSGVLTARPSRDLPKVIVSLLEMGAPVANPNLQTRLQNATLYARERPLNFELIERLIRWLVPIRERAAAAGMGRRQVLLIAVFISLMTANSCFYEYWSILGDQDEFFIEGQLETIEATSFRYLTSAAYAVGQSARTVAEARPFLPSNVTSDQHRVVAVILSGLRYDAFEQTGDGDGAALARWRASLDAEATVLCKLTAEVPSLAEYSSIFEVLRQLSVPAALVGTPWHVDLIRPALEPLEGDGSVSASSVQYEAIEGLEANEYDEEREAALLLALNSSSRLLVGQFSQLNTAGFLHGASYARGSTYASAIAAKAALLDRVVASLSAPDAPPTTLLVLSEHGHLERGGAGGGSADEREVPLLAYRFGSRLGLPPGSGGMVEPDAAARCEGGSHSTIDVPTTMAGLLGVPVPRHCQGTYVEAVFDASAAAPFDAVAEAAGNELRTVQGIYAYRSLTHWQWEDIYYQRHAFTDQYLLNPDVNRRAELDALDTKASTSSLLEAASTSGDATAYKQLLTDVQGVLDAARDASARASGLRNQCVAAFILLLVFALAVFAMQIQTFCDPLVVLIPSRSWRHYQDSQAALFCLGLVLGYYSFVIVVFAIFLGANSFPWSSSVVALPQNIWTFLLITLLPGVAAAYLLNRVVTLRWAVWPSIRTGISPLGVLAFIFVDEVQAFQRIEMLYLARFYFVLWALFGACILGVLSSRFSFIVPLVFYNKYVDTDLWEFRFIVMTVQLMTLPLLAAAMWGLFRWSSTRVDLQAMASLNELKIAKFDRRQGDTEESFEQHSFIRSALKRASGVIDGKGQPTAAAKLAEMFAEEGVAEEDVFGAANGSGRGSKPRPASGTIDLNERFEEVHQEILERRQEHADMQADMRTLNVQSMDLQDEIDEIMTELQQNQDQINHGVKELETLIVRRFEEMQQAEEDEKAAKAALAVDAETKFSVDEDDENYVAGLDPAARRQLRRQRLVEEQRKRIAFEEKDKAEADGKIRTLQAELAKLLEANKRLQYKVESCEHTVDETRDAIEDMSFQMSQCTVQKENALAVLTGETNYLTEHQIMVQRKASELTSKMAEIEASITAGGYKLQRVLHANELGTADRRRELVGLQAEVDALKQQFERMRDDVRVLYTDKTALHSQLASAQKEAADAEQTVANYRKSAANLLA